MKIAYLHMTTIALFPVDIWTFWTWLAISSIEDVTWGTLSSGHFKHWNRVTVNPELLVDFSDPDFVSCSFLTM